jgi:DNA-binding response OmpR family regulator
MKDQSLTFDRSRCIVKVGENQVHLAPKEFSLLSILVEAGGVVVSRESLLEKIWGIDESLEIDTRTVDQHISRIRMKLGEKSNCVRTVPSRGYSFRGGVQTEKVLKISPSLEKDIRKTLENLNSLLLKANKI